MSLMWSRDVLPEPLALSIAKNGPILFKGTVAVENSDRTAIQSGAKGALCRCGASENRPYSDGSHVGVGFEAD